MQHCRPHARLTESESAWAQYHHVVLVHIRVGCLSLTSTVGRHVGCSCLHLAGSATTQSFVFHFPEFLVLSLICYYGLLSFWMITLFIVILGGFQEGLEIKTFTLFTMLNENSLFWYFMVFF